MVWPRFIIDFVRSDSNVHCGDGAIDDARVLGRNDRGAVAVNAYGRLAGLASSPN
jgi:hypothetical protein